MNESHCNHLSENDVQHVIVMGFPRSGTTLLRRLLDAQSRISCPPEPWLTTACARFIRETQANGVAIGVMTGLGFSGIQREEILDPLRNMMFRFHERMAGGKPIRIEKSGFDIFYLRELEQLFAGHCRFICMVRHPLDVIASVKVLCDGMGCYPPELHPYVTRNPGFLDAFADAWIERSVEMNAFMRRNEGDCHLLRYEDLLEEPVDTLNTLLRFLGAEPITEDGLQQAASGDLRIGLGDWKVYESNGIQEQRAGGWRGKLPRDFVSRVAPRLNGLITYYGYDSPRVPGPVGHEKSIQQFRMAMELLRAKSTKA
jgi:hypothetical protein